MNYTDEHVALCALNKIFGFHPTLALSLLKQADMPTNLFDGHLATPPDNADATLAGLLSQLVPGQLEWGRKELERVESRGFRFLTLMDEDYPAVLRELPDPPVGLYLNGTSSPTEIFSLRPMIGIVGTRDISPYGRDWCRKLVLAMGEASVPPCIVSGLAFGADGIAHRTALECGLTTVGVMATGIEKVYPWQHTELAGQMVRTPGCAVVTDYPTGSAPVALNFIRRNRIIAGLSRATVVIESKTKGGSLITAKYACDYNRDVYALPGRADDVRSAGCNSLIRQRMADIVTDPEDLVERLGLGKTARRRKAGLEALLGRKYGADSPLIRLALVVKGHPGISLDEIVRETGWSWPEVQERAAILETDGFLETDLLRRCTIPAKIV